MGRYRRSPLCLRTPAAELRNSDHPQSTWKDVFSGNPNRRDIDYRRKREDFQNPHRPIVGHQGPARWSRPGHHQGPEGESVLFETLHAPQRRTSRISTTADPYRAVAADLETGEMIVASREADLLCSTCSMVCAGRIPLSSRNGSMIDGGIVRNVPKTSCGKWGPKSFICIDVDKPLADEEGTGWMLFRS